MASHVNGAKYYGGMELDTLRALAKARCLNIAGIDTNAELVAMLIEQDGQTGCGPWAKNENIPELESGRAWNTEEEEKKKKKAAAPTPDKEEKAVDAADWEITSTNGENEKEKTRLGNKMYNAPVPVTESAHVIFETEYTAVTPVSKAEVETDIKDDVSSIAENEFNTAPETIKPKSEPGSSTKVASVTIPSKGKDAKKPISIAQLASEWDAEWANYPKLDFRNAGKGPSYAGMTTDKTGSLESGPNAVGNSASKPAGQELSTDVSMPASSDKPTSPNKPALSKMAEPITSDYFGGAKTEDWAAAVEAEIEMLAEKEKENPVEKKMSPPNQDQQELLAANINDFESGEKAKKKRKRSKKVGKKVNKGKNAGLVLDEPVGMSAVTTDVKKKPGEVPATASPPDTGAIKQLQGTPTTLSPDESAAARVVRETAALADGQKENATKAIASYTNGSKAASSTNGNAGIINESSSSVALAECRYAENYVPEVKNSPVKKNKNKKSSEKGGGKVQKKAKKTVSGAQVMNGLEVDKTKALTQGYEMQAGGLVLILLMFCAAFLRFWNRG